KFLYSCPSCHCFSNAMEAPWCDCIGPDRSPRCKICNHCFCNASNEFKTEFWRRAPKALHTDHRQQIGRTNADRLTAVTSDLPENVARPLVLVVDDSRLVRISTLRILKELGYGTMEAADADNALTLIKLYRPDLVISDALMPKTDGREMCRAIKSDPAM